MRILITGAGGFIGSWLNHTLQLESQEVYGWHFSKPARSISNERSFPVDITNPSDVSRLIRQIRPDVIFHLAAQSFPRRSLVDPNTTFRVNVGGTFNLFHAVLDAGIAPKILSMCSSAEYASGELGMQIQEDSALAPTTPYGQSKLIQDLISENYAGRLGLQIIRVRPFFVIGPGKTGDVCSDFARRFVAAREQAQRSMPVGDMDLIRDFLDVRDAVQALLKLSDQGVSGEVYNVCSGKGRRIQDIFDTLNNLTGLSLSSERDPSLMRPVDEISKVGDPSRLMALGWRPNIPFEQSIRDILEYWSVTPSPTCP